MRRYEVKRFEFYELLLPQLVQILAANVSAHRDAKVLKILRVGARGWLPAFLALMYLVMRAIFVGNATPVDSAGRGVTAMIIISLFISCQLLAMEGEQSLGV